MRFVATRSGHPRHCPARRRWLWTGRLAAPATGDEKSAISCLFRPGPERGRKEEAAAGEHRVPHQGACPASGCGDAGAIDAAPAKRSYRSTAGMGWDRFSQCLKTSMDPDFLYAARDKSAYATFFTESRMRFIDSDALHRKS